jgi:hypothetical protein
MVLHRPSDQWRGVVGVFGWGWGVSIFGFIGGISVALLAVAYCWVLTLIARQLGRAYGWWVPAAIGVIAIIGGLIGASR